MNVKLKMFLLTHNFFDWVVQARTCTTSTATISTANFPVFIVGFQYCVTIIWPPSDLAQWWPLSGCYCTFSILAVITYHTFSPHQLSATCNVKSNASWSNKWHAWIDHCPYLLYSETTAKRAGLESPAGKEDHVELDSLIAIPGYGWVCRFL